MAVKNVGTGPPAEERHHDTAAQRRLKYGVNLSVLLLATLVIIVAINWFAVESKIRVDLTATRAYSLSPQTQRIVSALDGEITLTLVFVEEEAGRYRQQVEDVLREFETRSDLLRIQRIDPTNPRSMNEYSELLERLKQIFADEITAYEQVIDEGRAQLEQVALFVRQESELLGPAMIETDPSRQELSQVRMIQRVLTGVPGNLELIGERIGQDMETDPNAGIMFPDWDGAISTVRAANRDLEQSFRQMAQIFGQAATVEDLPARLADYLSGADAGFNSTADELANLNERIQDLDPLGIMPIIRSLRQSNAVLVSNASNAVVIPFEDLFPRAPATEDEGGIGDRRFAGEEVIAAAIRRLTFESQPVVVFCYAQTPPDPRSPQPQAPPDFQAAASELEDFGFDVRRWNVASPRPEIGDSTGRTVWVIATSQPNQPQMGAMPSGLADVATQLVEEGENILMSYWPSFSPGFGQPDFWTAITEPLGVTADTGRVIFEQIPQPGASDQTVPTHVLTDYNRDHPIGGAVDGLPTVIEYAVPLAFVESGPAEEPDAAPDDASGTDAGSGETDDAGGDDTAASQSSSINRTVLLDLEPRERVFASEDWTMGAQSIQPPDEPTEEPFKIAVAVERPVEGAVQRAVIVGAGSWYWSPILRAQQLALGQGIITPRFPGNTEFFTSSVLWLATLDEMIAPSPTARAVARVGAVSSGARVAWGWLLIGGLPLLSLVVGVTIWFTRRG